MQGLRDVEFVVCPDGAAVDVVYVDGGDIGYVAEIEESRFACRSIVEGSGIGGGTREIADGRVGRSAPVEEGVGRDGSGVVETDRPGAGKQGCFDDRRVGCAAGGGGFMTKDEEDGLMGIEIEVDQGSVCGELVVGGDPGVACEGIPEFRGTAADATGDHAGEFVIGLVGDKIAIEVGGGAMSIGEFFVFWGGEVGWKAQ